ncbi:MAG: biopolymer transporter Tol, partial [Ignavibacteriaceae bacterium]
GADSSGGDVKYDLTIPTDVTYNLFEFDFVARHQIINRYQNLELRFIYSKYTATIGSFVIPTDTGPFLYPTTDDPYFIGRDFRVRYNLAAITPTKDSDINPVGLSLDLMYDFEWNEYNESGDYVVEDGLLKPKFDTFNFHKIELNTRLYFPLWSDQTFTIRLRAASILGPEVPSFFNYFLGGLVGIRAYPFYAVEGNEIAWLHLEYRFPLFRNIDSRFGHLYLDKIFLSGYFDIGDAWTGESWKFDGTKKGVGAELRIHMNSYYLFPTAIFFDAAYGFDQFNRVVNREIITYGKEWQFYGGILFGFDIVNLDNNLKF